MLVENDHDNSRLLESHISLQRVLEQSAKLRHAESLASVFVERTEQVERSRFVRVHVVRDASQNVDDILRRHLSRDGRRQGQGPSFRASRPWRSRRRRA